MHIAPSLSSFPGRRTPLTLSLAAAIVMLSSCGGGSGTKSSQIVTPPTPNGAQCSLPPSPVTVTPTTPSVVGTTIPATFMDLHVGNPNLIPSVAQNNVSYGSLRLWDTSTGWSEENPSQGQYDFTNLDGFIDGVPAGVDLLYTLARTPTWASSQPTNTNCGYATIAGGPGQCAPPTDLNSDGSGTDADWIAWVTAVALHNASMGDKIKYFEIWNEWNIPLFWVGTPAQLVRMEQDARCVVEGPPAGLSCNGNKSVFPSGTALDPAAKIVTPSPVGAATAIAAVQTNLQNYFGTIVGGFNGGAFADVIGFHGYVSTSNNSVPCPTAENVISVVNGLNTAVIANGSVASGKPWFDTENGWGKAPDEGFTDPDRQAAFLARDYLIKASLGVARAYFYRWDSPQADEALFLNSGGSGTIEEPGVAFGVVNTWLTGATISSSCSSSGSVWTCGFTRSGGYKALAVWDTAQDCSSGTCTTSTYTVPAGGYNEYIDLSGKVNPVSGSTVSIGAKPILLENGTLP